MTTSIMVDFLLLCVLIATIVYAAKLSLQLKNLRNSKSDMEKTVRTLIAATDRAYAAMQGLRLTAQEQGQDLQDVIDKALALRDELQVMTDSGHRLSARMETLLGDMRPHASQVPQSSVKQPVTPMAAPKAQPMAAAKPVAPAAPAKKMPALGGFNIRDPEVERGMDPMVESMVVAKDDADGLSEAERDLLRALGKQRGNR